MNPPCPDCQYLHDERQAIAQHDGHMPYAEALKLAQAERCPAHTPAPVQTPLGDLLRAAIGDTPTHRPPR